MTALTLLFALLMLQEPAQKCRLSGTVTDSVSGMPLNRVQVLLESLDSSQAAPAIANTNAQGYFSMVDFDSGQYRVKGVRNGYLDTYYGGKHSMNNSSQQFRSVD
jgi:5-hydroxyisourate hydrolase-like protein (transthyretin family)